MRRNYKICHNLTMKSEKRETKDEERRRKKDNKKSEDGERGMVGGQRTEMSDKMSLVHRGGSCASVTQL